MVIWWHYCCLKPCIFAWFFLLRLFRTQKVLNQRCMASCATADPRLLHSCRLEAVPGFGFGWRIAGGMIPGRLVVDRWLKLCSFFFVQWFLRIPWICCLRWFVYGLYHRKSLLNHHVGEYFYSTFFQTSQANPILRKHHKKVTNGQRWGEPYLKTIGQKVTKKPVDVLLIFFGGNIIRGVLKYGSFYKMGPYRS